MVIVNAILYLSSVWYSILSYNHFLIKILPYWFLTKNIRNCRKYNIFFNFRFTENMTFPSIAENPENMIFTLSMFTKMLFFMHILIFLIILHFVIFSRIEKNAFFLFLTKILRKACTLRLLDKTHSCRRCLAQQYYRNAVDFKHYEVYVFNAALRRSGFSVRHFLLFELTQDKITCTV